MAPPQECWILLQYRAPITLQAERRTQPDYAWETGIAESDPKPLAPAPSVLANLNCQIAVLFNFSDKPTVG
jgi:hypothetical protein